ncbi:hypothetical protein E9549_14190 [Blastococcus sp. MG754426]|uniref:hypothetical protein n=1 Tax=unclassified Blastococcus TaxID=2619396 RepID=UPI001EF104A3|nr:MULTISPECIES: hypothetical protein [unclassified Blastococcus]MCF6508546.1 hypothetical protein [Blastococcus sp. MG754426]MCF6510737.1 hypothetical protein [Blastococcus sp. MG754427]
MSTPPTRSGAFAALVGGAATAAWYATPDLIPSRTARGWAKAAIMVASLTASAPDLRAARVAFRDLREEVHPAEAWRALPPTSKAALAGVGSTALAASVAGVVAGERWAFRRGQARAAAGKRWPHAGPALVYGALASALWLIPPPGAPGTTGGDHPTG